MGAAPNAAPIQVMISACINSHVVLYIKFNIRSRMPKEEFF